MATIAENIQTLRSIKSDIKNAITNKGGSIGNDFKTYAQAITDLPSGGGGGTENEDALVTRTLSVYSNDRVSVVGNYAFYSYSALKSVDLLNCKLIGAKAFAYCSALQSINLPNCSYLDSHALSACSLLINVNLPLCMSINNEAMFHCTALQSIDLPKCKYLSNQVFGFCSSLTNVKIPLCSDIGNYAFRSCINLKEVYLNSVTSVTTISSKTFSECPNLTSVYVPASLVDAFKTARYWSSMSTKIVAYTGA